MCPCELGEAKRRARVRHDLGWRIVDESLVLEPALEVLVERLAVPAQQLRAWDALGRIFGVQVEGQPFDRGTEPALEPLGRTLADAAEGSDVVRPDQDLVGRHPVSLSGWTGLVTREP